MRCAIVVVVGMVLGCGPRAPRPPTAAPPKVVVLLVIDQLPTWAFERDRHLFVGGFARLLRDGLYVRAAELPYANTFTAPGHATIGTGAPPSVHGVIGNQWFRRADKLDLPAEDDPAAPVLAVDPTMKPAATETGSSRALKVDGLAEALRAANPRAKSIAIALKPRAAAFLAGRKPDLAVWYEATAGGMTTSRAYASEVPAWLRELARTKPTSRFVGKVWEARDPELLANATKLADNAPGEGEAHGLGVTFPHPIKDPEAIVHTPFGDEVVLDAALAALDGALIGADDVPDLLAISLNAHDYCGHMWGPDAWETLDLTLRLDAALGRFFETLDARFGPNGWAVVLTSDHGATPVVERSGIAGARRISTKEITSVVDAAVTPILGPGPWVAKVSSNQIYVGDNWKAADETRRPKALAAAIAALEKVPGLARAADTAPLSGKPCSAFAHELDTAICFALAPGEHGEIYLAPQRGSLVTDYTTGTHHDSPNDDNQLVPILVRAPGVAPRVLDRGSLLQVAPTVAALLGIAPPSVATAKPLFDPLLRP